MSEKTQYQLAPETVQDIEAAAQRSQIGVENVRKQAEEAAKRCSCTDARR